MKKTLLDKTIRPINRFIHYDNSGGIALFLAVILALIWANSPWRDSYHHIWHTYFSIGFADNILSYSLHHWVNDGLMAMFFFVVGLELKREIIAGELSTIKKAVLPMAAAAGGMVFPALIYVFINQGEPTMSGWGIPMATDIVFALALMSLAGKKVPLTAKVFLVALATVDDLGAVLVIAFFYSSDLSFFSLFSGLGLLSILVGANLMGVRNTIFYAVIGIGGVWLAFLLSGVHATIAGVLVAFAIPARTRVNESLYSRSINYLLYKFDKQIPIRGPLMTPKQHRIIEKIKVISRDAQTPLQKIEGALHPIVTFVVIPLFALSNAGVEVGENFFSELMNPVSIGVFFGLTLGKLVGVLSFVWVLVKAKVAQLPRGMNWMHIAGIAGLAGVGFTMSLFITALAFDSNELIDQSKYGILLASVVSGTVGVVLLKKA
ncbi:Na+/H+ antiporter NhaA [Litoribacter alkaliphilus]|uniref:Na(+)/H(+) antiporter NhaA n=1 Tax=Litoribacter ruber TaxID=702568 RepID=A0AAP2CKP0_9BACT|nr:Na+/H+ antiporter NhaA [Litoribacter alkaliphilus]MBS9525464.1 Na+/H+ antiporter NhaA [Litoribacter alkaliphilus]